MLASDSSVASVSHDEYDGIEVRESLSDESSSEDEATSTSAVLSVPGRVFLVHEVARAAGGHRPFLLLVGCFANVSFGANGHFELQHIEPSDLQLSLRYEPPSPKFSRSCPGGVSYRLKLVQGSQFLYLLRGLPKELCQDGAAQALSWGPLKVMFEHPGDLARVVAVLRHVDVLDRPLWPPPAAITSDTTTHLTTLDEDNKPATVAEDSGTSSQTSTGWSHFSWSHSSTQQRQVLFAAGAVAAVACIVLAVLSARSRRHGGL